MSLLTVLLAGPLPGQIPLDVVPIRSAAFDSLDDFADLDPLIAAIGPARMVVLGEATHSDGAASRVKARLARFLHARMGFDVLAWETGFLQADAMNTALRRPDVSLDRAAAYLMSGGWATDADIRPLLVYARATWGTGRPLEMAGFDTGRPHYAAPVLRARLDDVFRRAPWLAPPPGDRALIDSLAVRGFGFISSDVTPDPVRTAQRSAVERLQAVMRRDSVRLRSVLPAREIAMLEATLDHLLTSEWLKEGRGMERARGRDRAMAELVRWLAEERYVGRKIVIWAATAHFIRHSDEIANAEHPDWYQEPYEAGNHLASWLGDDLYTIAVTSYGGVLGETFREGSSFSSTADTVTPAPAGSIEAMMHAAGHPLAFLDLRGLPDSHPLREPQVSLALGRFVNTARWPRIVDAFVFVDQSEPVRHGN